jgi:hypothetical protein
MIRGERWLDRDAGPVARPYTLTRGRTRPSRDGLGLVDLVAARSPGSDLRGLPPEQRTLVELSRVPVTIADLASDVDLPLNVVQVLIGDLCASGHLRVLGADAGQPDESLIRSVLERLRSL